MPTAVILELLRIVPSIFAAAQQIRASLSETDQATLDAAVDAARSQALVHIAQAQADLNAAAED